MKILIRYGEIGLKSAQVQTKFRKQLRRNLDHKLKAKDIEGHILETEGRIFAEVEEDDVSDAVIALSTVPGVVSVSPVVTTGLTMDEIEEAALDVLGSELATQEEDDAAFAVRARRAGEHEFSSKDIENKVGQAIVDKYNLDVDLDNPDVTVSIEARYKNAYVSTQKIMGIGGLPVTDRNKVVVLMEDRASTVAAYSLMKRGSKVYPLYTGHEAENLEEDMNILRQFDPDVKLTVMKGKDTTAALEDACSLFEAEAVAFGTTAAELDDIELPDVEAEILLPNCGFDQEAILDQYGEISYVTV